MTFFNYLSNLNMNFCGINNMFTPNFGMFQSFSSNLFNFAPPSWSNLNFNLPSFFDFTSNFNNSLSFNNIPNFNTMSIWNCSPSTTFNNFNYNFSFSTNPNFNNSICDTFSKSSNNSLGIKLAHKAKSYVNRVNSDKEGNRLFSNSKSQAWCADFVSYNIREVYGNQLPYFKHFSSVSALRDWGDKNNCYKRVPSTQRANFIRNNVKVGDIMIEKIGKSHTGIVTKVNSDGSFEVVEGNCSNKVDTRTYEANSRTLSGFISMEKFTKA